MVRGGKKGGCKSIKGVGKCVGKRGQFQMSFGMIFSMFLIVIFLVVAFVVIKNFLDIGKEVEERQLVNDLNDEIKRLSQSTSSGTNILFEGNLGDTKVTHVCFFDSENVQRGRFVPQYEDFKSKQIDEEHNFYFYPREQSYTESARIELVNMSVLHYNPYCVIVRDGKVEFKLNKNIGEYLVRIS